MARLLILDYDGPNATLVVGSSGRAGFQVEQVRTWTESQPIALTSADAMGRALRERLSAWKLLGRPLIVGVGRERVVLKEIKYPAVPDHEEPGIVRFQALKELTDAAEELVIDYQPRPSSGQTERRALVVAAKKEVLKVAQLCAQAAGVKLLAVVPKVYGLIALLPSAQPVPDPATAVGVMALGSTGGEFIVCRGEQVLFARPVSLPAVSSDQTMLGEIRRNLAIYNGQAPQCPVKALYVAEGGALVGITERIRDVLAFPVHRLDPLAGAPCNTEASAGQLASPIGLGKLSAGRAFPINFVKPREPRPARDPARRPLIMGAALAASLLLALGYFAWSQIAAKDRELANMRRERDDLNGYIALAEPDAKRYDEVKKWMDGDVVWLDELYDLTARIPDLTKLRIVQLLADPIAVAGPAQPGKKQYVGRITLKGLVTRDSKPLSQFMNELTVENNYRVDANNITANLLGIERGTFSNQFITKYEVEKRTPSSYSRTFVAEAPERRNRNRDPGGTDLLNIFGGQP